MFKNTAIRIVFLLMLAGLLFSCKQNEKNEPPIASAQADKTDVKVGDWVQLDGSKSRDPEGAALKYNWQIIAMPAGSNAVLNNPELQKPSFQADKPGDYTVRLVVYDGFLYSKASDVTVTATDVNHAPVAVVGANRQAPVGQEVVLDGSSSYDPDGDEITYKWYFLSKPNRSVAEFAEGTDTTSQAKFTPDVEGDYVINLIVTDVRDDATEQLSSSPATITIRATRGNSAPVAVAGQDVTVNVGQRVTFNGSGSYDPDGDSLWYSWSIVSAPAGSVATLRNATSVMSYFTPDVEGDYEIGLVVSDGFTSSEMDTVVVTAVLGNVPPVAVATAKKSVLLNKVVNLDGTKSHDDNLDTITYNWTFQSRPDGSSAVIMNYTSPVARFIPDVEGEYVINLYVNDGEFTSEPARLVINAYKQDAPPVAVITGPSYVKFGDDLTLSGETSYDPDGNTLTYKWSLDSVPEGSAVTLTDDTQSSQTITPDVEGDYVFSLVVNDGTQDSDPATFTVTVKSDSIPPVAVAGSDIDVEIGGEVILDGSQSYDLDGQIDSYHWFFISTPDGFDGSLIRQDTINPGFTASIGGIYIIGLFVQDNDGLVSDLDTVVVNAKTDNRPPVANAGSDLLVALSDAANGVTLDGSLSFDPDGDTLSFTWSFVSKPNGSSAVLDSTDTQTTTFIPDVVGDYVISLVVSDGADVSDPDLVTVTVYEDNTPPVAVVPSSYIVKVNEQVVLDGSSSYDVNNDTPLSYEWSFVSIPSGSAIDTTPGIDSTFSFTPDVEGTYRVKLRVTDSRGLWDEATVDVNAIKGNAAPVADAGKDLVTQVGLQVDLDGSASYDPNGDTLTYSWRLVNKPTTSSLSVSGDSVNYSFTPDVEGIYVLELTVTDPDGASDSDTVQVTAIAGNAAPVLVTEFDPIIVRVGQQATVDASNSFDPNPADTIEWNFRVSSKPEGSSDQNVSYAWTDWSTNGVFQFTPDVAGDYNVDILLRDNNGAVTSGSVTVRAVVGNVPPVAVLNGDTIVVLGNEASFDCNGSYDPDGGDVTCHWQVTQKPDYSLVDVTGSVSGDTFSFTPDIAGTYGVKLVVQDVDGSSATAFANLVVTVSNVAPVAVAGDDLSWSKNVAVTLDGSNSYDPNPADTFDTLSLEWEILSVPAGSSVLTGTYSGTTLTFTPDIEGNYVVQLIVTDTGGLSSSDVVTVTAVNDAPVAELEAITSNGAFKDHYIATPGENIVLSGVNSSDINGDPIFYNFYIKNRPSGSSASLVDTANDYEKSFTPDVEGTYEIALVVDDGDLESNEATITIDVVSNNAAPVADAGLDQVVNVGSTVTLDGSLSYDPNGDSLSYSWHLVSKPSTSSVLVTNATSATYSFTPDIEGSYTFELVVTDTEGLSSSDQVTITAVSGNAAPVADAGDDVLTSVGVQVNLDGSGSYDPNGDPISYEWILLSKPANSALTVSNATSVTYSFTPYIEGSYVFELKVTDSKGAVSTDTVTVTVVSGNAAPVVVVKQDPVIVSLGNDATVDASESYDPNVGDTIEFNFRVISKPQNSSDQNVSYQASGWNPDSTFTFTPDVVGDYVVEVSVRDNNGLVSTRQVTIKVVSGNLAPVVVLNGGGTLLLGQAANFDCDGSYDPDGKGITCSWEITQIPDYSNVSIPNSSTGTSYSFTPDIVGTYIVKLVVTDDDGLSSSKQASVVVINGNVAPVADAGQDMSWPTNVEVTLDGSGSYDPNPSDTFSTLTLTWSLLSKPTGSSLNISAQQGTTFSFTPDVDGNYVVQLVVQDQGGLSDSDTVTIVAENTKPVADIAADIGGTLYHNSVLVTPGSTVNITGVLSSDQNGDSLTYSFYLKSRPNGSSATLSAGVNSYEVSLQTDIAGSYEVGLIVNDGQVDSDEATIVIDATSDNKRPVAKAFEQSGKYVGYLGDTFTLDGNQSYDPNGDALTYYWSIVSLPNGSSASLTSTSGSTTSFTADARGTYYIALVVNDGQADSDPAVVQIKVINRAPVADAGTNSYADVGDLILLDGSNSTDPDNDTLTYQWTLESTPDYSNALIWNQNSKTAYLYNIDFEGTYVVRLTVTDQEGAVSWAERTITVVSNTANSYNDQALSSGGSTGYLSPSVIYDSNNGILKMWFTEDQPSAFGNTKIMYAESTDGITWNNVQYITLSTNCAQWWENYMCSQPSVIYDTDTNMYKMWYAGAAIEPAGGTSYYLHWHIGYATSNDGINWTVQNNDQPVLFPGPGGKDKESVAHPGVIKLNSGIYIMYYAGSQIKPKDVFFTYKTDWQWDILLATSTDGINWIKKGRVIQRGDGGFYTDQGVLSPMITWSGNSFKLFYTGIDPTGMMYVLSAVTMDLKNFSGHSVVVTPTGNGWNADSVLDPTVIYTDTGKYNMWYVGDQGGQFSIGLFVHP